MSSEYNLPSMGTWDAVEGMEFVSTSSNSVKLPNIAIAESTKEREALRT